MLVSIVIPCYNSEKTIGMVADQCMECFSQWDGYECEMILVNDHSRDQTYAAILKCQERYPGKITAVNFAKNFGQHAAINLAHTNNKDGEVCQTIGNNGICHSSIWHIVNKDIIVQRLDFL